MTTLPADVWNLTNLTYLDLQFNSLTNLPAEIVNLNNLQAFYLTSNTWLWQLNSLFWNFTPNRSQLNIPTVWQTMTIWWNGTTVVISVTP